MANDTNQNGPKKGGKPRGRDDLELLKIILDEDPALKKRVIKFMQKNYAKVMGQGSK